MVADSHGWPQKLKRAFDPLRPLYVYKSSGGGGIWIGETHVPRGHRLSPEHVDELGLERVKLMHFVRELDHSPIDGLTPIEQIPGAAPRRKQAR